MKSTPKATIKQNLYGNWYGYIGGKKVAYFANSSTETQEQQAKAWLEAQDPSPESSVPAPLASTDARGWNHLIFPADSENRVQHYVKRDGVWSGIEKVNQASSQPGTILDCDEVMQEDLDKVFAKCVPAPAEDVACVTRSRECPVCKVAVNPDSTWCRMCGASLAPSPAEPVKVLGGEILALAARVDDGGPFVEFGQSYGELTMVARFNGGTHQQKLEVSDMIVDSCFKARSHAAHLAKIQRLETALTKIANPPHIHLDDFHCCTVCKQWMPVGHPEAHDHLEGCTQYAHVMAYNPRDIARAALSLPSA